MDEQWPMWLEKMNDGQVTRGKKKQAGTKPKGSYVDFGKK